MVRLRGPRAHLQDARPARWRTSCSIATTSPRLEGRRAGPALELRRRRRACSAWSPRRSASAWRTSSTRCWPSTPPSSIRCRTRSRRSTSPCCRASRCASCSPTTRAPARPSWPGLLIKELIARGDLQRCLIVCPGSLAEQWQDELYRRFHLPFEILTNDKLEAARTGNWFLETNLVIARLDKLSRNEDVQQKLQAPDCRWDLIVCDEAHKMSATVFGGEIKYTKRYRLGQLLSTLTRHFLLMTATPHNGKEEDFQLFMALLDGDRFEGRFRDGVHVADVSDLMRRMVKENLLKFDGTPLFPERIAYTVPYKLSEAEAHLYKAVTDYVREEFNRAEALENDKRAGTVGFALTILQRRLASSPEAIYQSLRRRRERLESRLRELEVLQRGGQAAPILATRRVPALDAEDVEDLEDAPDNEVEAAEEEILDQATAARSIAELKAEIETLKGLESLALGVRRSGTDTKWRELASLLGEIFTTAPRSRNRVAEAPAPPTAPARSRRRRPRRTRSSSSSPSTATR